MSVSTCIDGTTMKIRISSYDNSRSRAERLNRVIGYVEGRKNYAVWKLIELHDHKGTLEVVTTATLPLSEQNLFREAWQSRICNEAWEDVIFTLRCPRA